MDKEKKFCRGACFANYPAGVILTLLILIIFKDHLISIQMIIYTVTLFIKKDIETEWLRWMKERHIPDVMEAGKFLNYKIFKVVIPSGEADEVIYSVHYECESTESYISYLSKDAPRLQREHSIKFPNKIKAARSVIEEI
jgi:hypothetical protein